MQVRESVRFQRAVNGGTMLCDPGGEIALADVCAPAAGEPGFQLGVRRLAKLVRGKDLQIEKRGEVDGKPSADAYVGDVHVNEQMRKWGYACK